VDLKPLRRHLAEVRQELDLDGAVEAAGDGAGHPLPPVRGQGDDQLVDPVGLNQGLQLRDRPEQRQRRDAPDVAAIVDVAD